jgi:signal transduction histidine kinase
MRQLPGYPHPGNTGELRKIEGSAKRNKSMPVETKARIYRTWPVFVLALSVLLGLMLVPTLTALRRSGQIYTEIRGAQQRFRESQQAFETLAQNVFSISITIREFLLDSSPEAGRTYLSKLFASWDEVQADIARLREILPAGERGILQELERELDAYWSSILPVFDWTPQQRADRGAYFLREEQRPTRQSVLAIADELAALNSTLYNQQQQRINNSEQVFRDDLKRSVLYAVLAGILVSLAGVLRIRWLERRAQQQHQEVEQTGEEMRNLSIRLRHAQEEERRVISRELHDEVGQKLTAMRMELGALERLRNTGGGQFDSSLVQIKGLAEQSLRIIRDIAAGLRPSMLDDLGLGAALQKQAREFSKLTGMPVSADIEGEFTGVGDRQRIYVYRIVQEALTNCAKHAHARQVALQINGQGEGIDLKITDDGVGFDPQRTAHSGLGLIGIEERVRELGGDISIQSAPQQGTIIHIRIPQNGKSA